ncbi:MAG: adenosylcobinamide-GDP ribazoletransferase [Betaproteobacteria bacterium]|nr:adenosylcobinamide-GDP ribazoletransferase [Betaproteobacteria bacterium]
MIRRELAAFFAAIGYFTRLPVPGWVGYSADGLSRAARYLPAIGLLVGGLGGLVFWLAQYVWPQSVAVVLAMVATIALTGAFHEDGLGDTADGLGGGWDKAKILTIMKDSRVGSYGVIAIVLALLGKFALLAALPAGQVLAALVAGHAVSRGCAVSLMATMDYARDDEASKARPVATRLGIGSLVCALFFAALPLLLLDPQQRLPAVALAVVATFWLAAKCRRWLGGYTGDCLGAVQQLAEIAFYLGLALKF